MADFLLAVLEGPLKITHLLLQPHFLFAEQLQLMRDQLCDQLLLVHPSLNTAGQSSNQRSNTGSRGRSASLTTIPLRPSTSLMEGKIKESKLKIHQNQNLNERAAAVVTAHLYFLREA